MPVTAIGAYEFEAKDRKEKFGGNIVVYLQWQSHLLFCAPLAFAFPPGMPFADLTAKIVPKVYGFHPECTQIDWGEATWKLDGMDFTPDMNGSLEKNGVGHKSVLRFFTPGLDGLDGKGV